MKLPWRIRLADRWERMSDRAHRPVCWIRGHRWVFKMDLHGGAICGRCGAYRKPRSAYRKQEK